MNSITIPIPPGRMVLLEELAKRYQISPEDLLRASLEELVTRPEAEFQRTLTELLRKNAELYRRLA